MANALARHKAAWLEQIAGAKVLAIALGKRVKYTGQTFEFLFRLPSLILHQQEQINRLRADAQKNIQIMADDLFDVRERMRHHEHGPLMQSARALAVKRQRAVKIALDLAKAKTKDERQAAEKAAAQLAEELETGDMPEADVTIDTKSGQTIDGEPGKPRIVRLHEQ